MSAVAQEPIRPSLRQARRRDSLTGYAFLSPWLIGFFLLTAGPMIASLVLAFTDYNIFRSPKFVGLDNFSALFSDPRFWQAWKVTGLYVLLAAPLKIIASLLVAQLLAAPYKGQSFYRSVFYAPSLIAASVSIALVWRAIFMDQGIVDRISESLGIHGNGWVGNPSMTLPMFLLLAVWAFGGPMVIFLAGLKQIPQELYEAADVDGASGLHKWLHVTLPMLSPTIFFNSLLEIIHSFMVFGSAFIISNGTGGPAGSTLFYTLYLYQRAFTDLKMGYASAMAWVFFVVIGILTALYFRASRAWVFYSGDTK